MRLKMKENYDISLLNERLNSIEKILELLVVNSLADNLNTVFSNSKEMQKELSDELANILKRNEFDCIDSEVRNGIKIIYVETEKEYKFNDFLLLDYKIKNDYSIIPVFSFKKINGNRRKRFIEERISFTTEKEIHIYTEL